MDLKRIAKTTALVTGIFAFWLLAFVFFGILLNWTFFGLVSLKLWGALQARMPDWHPAPFVLTALVFVLGFPLMYFLGGKLFAVQKAIAAIFRTQRTFLFDYFAMKLTENPELLKSIHNPGRKGHAWIKRLGRMPWPIRFLFGFVDDRIDILASAARVYDGMEPGSFDPDRFSERMNQDLGPKIEEHLLNPSWRIPALLLGINLSAMIFLVYRYVA